MLLGVLCEESPSDSAPATAREGTDSVGAVFARVRNREVCPAQRNGAAPRIKRSGKVPWLFGIAYRATYTYTGKPSDCQIWVVTTFGRRRAGGIWGSHWRCVERFYWAACVIYERSNPTRATSTFRAGSSTR